jgi:hypothetical protein
MQTVFSYFKKKIFKNFKIQQYIQTLFEKMDEDMIDLQQIRLEKKGEYVDGMSLRTDSAKDENLGLAYSQYTTVRKFENGNEIKFVNLKDTGEFYDSMKLATDAQSLQFIADFSKEGSDIWDNFTYQKDAEGFVKDVFSELRPFFLIELRNLLYLHFNNDIKK